MIWKIIVTLSVALYVQGEEDAISEQRIVIHHQTSPRDNSLSHKEPKKSGTQDEYARAYPSYEFSYSVNDPKTRDIKGQHEKREGDEVNGNYWLIEPNGRKRTVNYQANDNIGFNAIIDYTASLKDDKKKENVEVNQSQDKNQSDVEINKEEITEEAVDEQVQDIGEDSGEIQKNVEPAPVVENNSNDQNESDNQEDEANNVRNIERIDINYDLTQPTPKIDSKQRNHNDISKSAKENQAHNVIENSKRENLRRPKNRGLGRNNNNSHKKSRNTKRVNIEATKAKENSNKSFNNGKKADHDKSLTVPQKNNIGDLDVTLNKVHKQFEGNQNHNGRKTNRFKNVENEGNNESYNVNFSPNDEIRTNVDIPDNEKTYEHRIRIYHPKNVLPRPNK